MFYKTIFNINMQHAYFLDQGNKKFSPTVGDETMTLKEKTEALKNYDIISYLKLLPTQTTKAIIKNHRMMTIPHKQGFKLVTNALEKTILGNKKYKPQVPLEDDTVLTFAIYTTDPNFNNYTEIAATLEHKLYLLSNTVTSLETAITNIFDGGGTLDTNYLMSENDTRTIIQTIIDEEEKVSNTITQFSLSNSITTIKNDDTLTTIEKDAEIETVLNQYIIKEKRNGLVGYFRLKVKGDNDKNLFQFIGNEQYVTDTMIEFTSRFKNRNTFWRYFSHIDDVTLTTEEKKPLTKNGFIEIDKTHFNPEPVKDYQYPNPTPTVLKKESSNYYSEIFI